MLSLGSERLHARIEEILSRRDAASYLGWALYIGEKDYSERVKEGGYVTEDGPAIALDLKVAGVIPAELASEEVYLQWSVGGIPVDAFTGSLLEARYDASEGISTLIAATAGDAMERTELGSRVEYGGVNPSTAINDALLRIAGYRQGLVEVQVIERPKFVRQGSEAYSATDFASDIVQGVQGENERLSVYDTASGGARALMKANLADMPEPVWTFEVDRDVKRGDFEDGAEDDLYREVVVRRQIENASPGTDPWEVLARVEVDGSKAQAGTVMRIDVSTSEDETAQESLDAAYSHAHTAATAQAYRIGRIAWTATYVHPLLERGDVVAVINPGKDERGEYVERWLCVLDRAHCEEVREKRGKYEGEGRVVATERPRAVPVVVGGLTPGVVPLSVYAAARSLTWDDPRTFEALGEYTFEELS